MRRRLSRPGVAVPVLVVIAALVVLPGAVAVGIQSATRQDRAASPPWVKTARAQLSKLRVKAAASMSGYSRERFGPAWEDVDHNGCDTRNDILARDLRKVVYLAGSRCVVKRGILHDPYTGKTIAFLRGVATSAKVQIDHVVALADAWRTGARQWKVKRRLAYANDPVVLLAVDGPTNEAKGDDDAASWLPPRASYRCRYVAKQITVKRRYTLWVTWAERNAMRQVLAGC